jgi:hypothetical protein
MAPEGSRQYRAILLGSPMFPKCGLSSPPSLRASARVIKSYLEEILALEENYELLDLFGSESAPNTQLQEISSFLKQARDDTSETDDLVILLFYIGHGYISRTGGSYCLAIHQTTNEYSLSDGIIVKELLIRLKSGAPQRKHVIFIDACFAGKAAGDAATLTDPESVILSDVQETPDPYTAIYCAVKGDSLALAPAGSKYTLFSHGVIHALKNGDGASQSLSIEKLDTVAWHEIQRRFSDISALPRPHLHFTDRPQFGDNDPIFPVASYAVDPETLKAVRQVLSAELTEFVDTIRDSLRDTILPEIEAQVLSVIDGELSSFRVEMRGELGSNQRSILGSVRVENSELRTSISDLAKSEVAVRDRQNAKSAAHSTPIMTNAAACRSMSTMPIAFAWHEILGVPPNADAVALQRAMARLARIYHPDKGGQPDLMRRVNAAYERAQSDWTR